MLLLLLQLQRLVYSAQRGSAAALVLLDAIHGREQEWRGALVDD